MRPGHADESGRLGLPHAGHDGIHTHARVDEHGDGTAAHHGIAQRQEISSRGHEHDHPLRRPQAGRRKAVLVGIDAGGERCEVERVVLRAFTPAGKRDLRHRRHPRRRRRGCLQGRIESVHQWPGFRGGVAGRDGGSGAQNCNRPEELIHGCDRLACRILQHEMRGGGNLHDFRRGKTGGDPAKDFRVKTGILHSPDDLHGNACQIRQAVHHVVHQGGSGVGRGKRDVADKAPDGLAAATGAVGPVVAPLDLLR